MLIVSGSLVALNAAHAGKDWKAKEAAEEAALTKKATISEATARATALEKVSGGTVKSSEIEEEKGLIVWSYDITTKGSKNITEVLVNAMTGKIVEVQVETPADIAKEEKMDAAAAAKHHTP